MMTMFSEPGLQEKTESPRPFTGPGLLRTAPSPRPAVGTVLLAELRWVGDQVIGLVLRFVFLVLQFVRYIAVVLALPLLPFLLPLLLLPVIFAFDLLILGVGAVLGKAGWL